MGRDNSPRARELARREAKSARRATYDRILIVTEGSRTEPQYLEEIRGAYRLHSANVVVQGNRGTAPLQVVEYAQRLFEKGDSYRGIRPRSFDRVFTLFDRDEHTSYFDALDMAQDLDNKLRNDQRQPIPFKAVVSIPCFELWFLLHYEKVLSPLSRDEVATRLKQHYPGYAKGAVGTFAHTRERLTTAIQRAETLAKQYSARTDPNPYTDLHELVGRLTTLRR